MPDDRDPRYAGDAVDLPNLDIDADADLPSPQATLDQIREGGTTLVALVRARLGELETAVFEGRFLDAFNLAQQVTHKLQPLAAAEGALGSLAEWELVKAEQVEEGMVVRGWGTVSGTRREEKPVPGDVPCAHIHLTFSEENQEDVELHATDELMVVKPD